MAAIGPIVFNGPVETGLRTLAALTAIHPASLDLKSLVIIDYVIVHSADVAGGPPSLHPPSPLRSGEVVLRRQLILDGVDLYMSRRLIVRHLSNDGIQYAAGPLAAGFLDGLKSGYGLELRERADWVVSWAASQSQDTLIASLESALGKWREEFAVLAPADSDDWSPS